MIVFLYVSRVTLNTKIYFPSPFKAVVAAGVRMSFVLSPCLLVKTPSTSNYEPLLSSYFTNMSSALVLFQVAYLLITLFTVVALAQSFKGAVRKLW